MMRRALFGLMLTATLAMPVAALAASNTVVGVGSGAVAGTLVAGPIGAVAGAVIGGVIGSSTERVRRPRRRRAGLVRQRRAAVAGRHPLQYRVEATPSAASETTWKNPR